MNPQYQHPRRRTRDPMSETGTVASHACRSHSKRQQQVRSRHRLLGKRRVRMPRWRGCARNCAERRACQATGRAIARVHPPQGSAEIAAAVFAVLAGDSRVAATCPGAATGWKHERQ